MFLEVVHRWYCTFPTPCLPRTLFYFSVSEPVLALKPPININVSSIWTRLIVSFRTLQNCFFIVGAYTLVKVGNLFWRGSLIVVIRSLTGVESSSKVAAMSFLKLNPTPTSLLSSSYSLVSISAATSILYLSISMATNTVCFSGQCGADLNMSVCIFYSATYQSESFTFFLPSSNWFLADCRRENRSARVSLFWATSETAWVCL